MTRKAAGEAAETGLQQPGSPSPTLPIPKFSYRSASVFLDGNIASTLEDALFGSPEAPKTAQEVGVGNGNFSFSFHPVLSQLGEVSWLPSLPPAPDAEQK
jgi:hypothetical protein